MSLHMKGVARAGELFVLGFRGTEIPGWLREFEREHGLGGVILFDYNCQTRTYENNIHSPEQVRELCAELSSLPSRPLIMVDQEGGKVRRLKEKLGFAPLPSAKAFNGLGPSEKRSLVARAFREMRELGFHYDLAPVVDLDYNPDNPDIGKVERSYSARSEDVRANLEILNEAARAAGLGLCLKHFPGLGAARVNSHEELTDLSGTITEEQLQIFYDWSERIFGGAALVSHGIVREWDAGNAVSMSPTGVARLRERSPGALLLSDDLQMQGLQKLRDSRDGSIQGLRAGLDMIVIGNNLMAEDEATLGIAEAVRAACESDQALCLHTVAATARVAVRKGLFG